jgi:hypothetical protein
MKKEIFFITIPLLLSVTPVLAASEHSKTPPQNHQMIQIEHSQDNSKEQEKKTLFTNTDDSTDSAKTNLHRGRNNTLSISPPICDPIDKYKNHGAYVSCIAHQHLQGKIASLAARTDIGKKQKEATSSVHFLTTSLLSDTSVLPSTYKKLMKTLHTFFTLISH